MIRVVKKNIRFVSKSFEQMLGTKVENKSCEQNLWSCEQKNLAAVVNKTCCGK